MKTILLVALSFVLSVSSFYDRLLSDHKRNSWFVCIETKFANEQKIIIIENDDLYYLLDQEKNMTKRDYSIFIKQKLIYKKTLILDNVHSKNLDILEYQKIKSVDANAKKGLQNFLKIYFRNKVLKKEFLAEKSAIIYKLFKWKILCKIDDETGFLYYYNL